MEYVFTKETYNTPDIYTHISEQENDRQWDSFIESNPAGYHEQTSMWAFIKKLEGWNSGNIKTFINK